MQYMDESHVGRKGRTETKVTSAGNVNPGNKKTHSKIHDVVE